MLRAAAWLMAIGLAVGAATPAEACGRNFKPPKVKKVQQVDPTLRDVTAAEKALGAGDLAKAGRLAIRAIPNLEQLPPANAAELATRAQRTLAIATVRSAGAIGPAANGVDAPYGQQVNLAWAELVLTYQSALKSDNLIVKVQLAEALAADGYQRERARDMLRELSSRDLMPTARGYAMLAQLEADATLRDAALDRCRELGGNAACKA